MYATDHPELYGKQQATEIKRQQKGGTSCVEASDAVPSRNVGAARRVLRDRKHAGMVRGLKLFLRGQRSESGEVIVMAAVGMSVILGFLAFTIDVGQVRYQKRRMQSQADAAAAALELGACTGTSNCAAMQAAATGALTENCATATTVTKNCGADGSAGLTLTNNDGRCAMGNADPNHGKTAYVEVLLSQTQPAFFGKLVGIDSVPVMVRAEAARATGPCMIALNPTRANAIAVDLLASVNSSCGMLDESKASGFLNNAFTCLGAAATASEIDVVGGTGSLLCATSPSPTMR